MSIDEEKLFIVMMGTKGNAADDDEIFMQIFFCATKKLKKSLK
jgi:hypothetical protein